MCGGLVPPLTEPAVVQDVFASGLAEIQDAGGGCVRFVLYSIHTCVDGKAERVVVAKIVMPACAVPEAVMITIGAVSECDFSIAFGVH